MLVLFGTPRGFLNQPDNCSRYVLWPLTRHRPKWSPGPFDQSAPEDAGHCAGLEYGADGRPSPCAPYPHGKGCSDLKSTLLFIFGTPRGFLNQPDNCDNCGRYMLWPLTGHRAKECGGPCRD